MAGSYDGVRWRALLLQVIVKNHIHLQDSSLSRFGRCSYCRSVSLLRIGSGRLYDIAHKGHFLRSGRLYGTEHKGFFLKSKIF